MTSQFQVLCLYHAPCPDGGFAAIACYMALGDKVLFEPHCTTTAFDLDACLIVNPFIETIYLLDYCGPSGFLKRCDNHPQIHKVVLIDHHKTAFEEVKNTFSKVTSILDLGFSGCTLAMYYFKPPPSKMTPSFELCFFYVEDNDLWNFNLPLSKEFTAGLRSLNIDWFDFASFKDEAFYNEGSAQQLIDLGVEQLRLEEGWILEALVQSFKVTLGGIIYSAAESKHWEITSDLGHRLCADTGYGVVFRVLEEDDSKVKLSLRSNDKSKDTTAFSSTRNGGGHACSSGCVISLEEWNSAKI